MHIGTTLSAICHYLIFIFISYKTDMMSFRRLLLVFMLPEGVHRSVVKTPGMIKIA